MCVLQWLTCGDVRRSVGVEHFDVAGGEAVPAKHGVHSAGIVGVPLPTTPVVPAARHDHRAVADLEQSTAAGATQGRVGGLAVARVVADRVAAQVRRGIVGRRPRRRAGRREADDVGAARQQLTAVTSD